MNDVTLEDLQRLEVWLRGEQKIGESVKDSWGDSSVHLRTRLVRAVFRKAFLMEKIPRNPADFWRVPRGVIQKRRPMTADEYAQIYEKAPPYFQPILEFLRLTGARGASVAALIWNDVDFESKRIRIRSKKGGLRREKEITLPLYGPLYQLLHSEFKRLKERGQPSRRADPVFWGPKGTPVTAQEIATEGSRVIKLCGLKGVVLYGLRHAIAVEMTAAGVPLEVVRQTLGHSKLEQTSHYASGISLDVVGDALAKIHPVKEIETPQQKPNEDEPPDLDEN